MTLEGAKFICLDEAGNHGKVVLAKGRKFTMGYYVNCDHVLVDERAKGVHCEIECDAFGRVTIRNLSPDKPILVNGSSVEIKRILLNNSKLSILDKEYLWIFSKSSSNEFEDLPVDDVSTPHKPIGIPEQAPNSCPDFKLHRDLPKRFTVHNFAYCIQSDEEGNTSSDSNNENDNENLEKTKSQIDKKSEIPTSQLMEKDSIDNTSQEKDSDKEKETRHRCITPEPNKQIIKPTTELIETPKMNLINYTQDKENCSTEQENKQLLKMCHQSDVVITSFSPRETGTKICRSFATVIKPKVLLTKPPTTPKSVYSTPNCDIYGKDQDDINQSDLIYFYTPSTSRQVLGDAVGFPASSIKVLKNSSMHLIDLTTTPKKQRPASPYLKPDLKASAKKNISLNVDKSCTKLPSEAKLGITAFSATPVRTDVSNNPLETISSVISVNSSVENSSVIEVTSDGSNTGLTPSVATDLNTPLKAQSRIGVCTPKRTPQSLMKKAILTSAKKQNATPLINRRNLTTPHREAINRIPLRSNLALPKSSVTPQVISGSPSISKLSGRQSMSTPIRKSETGMRFGVTHSTSNIASESPSTSTKSFSRRSSLNPISAAKVLPTSTPISGKSMLKNRIPCKTSPLHRVRKSLGGVPLSSHISKVRKSTILSVSTSKITSLKDKSPQQVMSDRLVNRARKSISSRSRNLVDAAKTPLESTCHSSVHKEKTMLGTKITECKVVLFAKKNIKDDDEADTLSRTFVLNCSEDEDIDVKRDATFSPEKDSAEKMNATDKKEEPPAIETPIDAEEVIDLCNENKENTNQTNNEENNIIVQPCHETKHSFDVKEDKFKDEKDNASAANIMKTVVTEESFAEEINASLKQNNTTSSKAILDNQVKCLRPEPGQGASNKNDSDRKNVAEIGFGEESSIEAAETSPNKIIPNKENPIITETETYTQSSRPDLFEGGAKKEFGMVLVKKAENEAKSVAEKADEANNIETKVDVQSSNEYKPIVEDITLEGSLIEKGIKDSEDNNINKQLYKDINLKDSLIEEKVKSEELKEENKKTAIEEPEDKEQQVNARSKGNEIFAHSETMKQRNTEVANIILTTNEVSANIQEKEESIVVESVSTEKSVSNPIDTELSYTNEYAENVEVKTETTKTPYQQRIMQSAKIEDDENETKNSKISQPEQAEVVQIDDKKSEPIAKSTSPINYEGKNFEDTNKLLEEIEDVLNKSDEIKQKHLNEIEQSSDKPLTEEFESEQFSQEKILEIDEPEQTENIVQKPHVQTDHVAEISSSGLCDSKSINENEKQTQADIAAESPICSAVEEHDLNTSVSQPSIVNAININLDVSEPQSELQKNKHVDKSNTKQNVSKDGNTATENTEQNDEPSGIKILDNKSLENQLIATTQNNKSSNVIVEQNILTEMDGNSTEIKVRNKNIENMGTFVPRRSTRRISQSSDVHEVTAELTFTPRRSTRRSSISVESTTTTAFTPTKRTTRRASLSTVNDTPLTPNPIIKRRVSISVEGETNLQQRAKTPRKQLERSMIIPEETDEICSAILEGEEVLEQEKMHFEKKKNRPLDKVEETEQYEENDEKDKAETILGLKATCQKELSKSTNHTEKGVEENLECNDTQAQFEANLEKNEVQKILEESSPYNTKVDQERCEELIPAQPETTKNANIVIEDKLSEGQTSKEIAERIEITLKDSIVSNLVTTANPVNVPETLSIEVSPKETKKVNILADSPKTPLMTGVRELLKTPKPEIQTPRLAGIRNLIRTPKNTEEDEAEEREKLGVLSNLVKTPEISTHKVKKHVTIAAESPKTPLLTGLTELLKTPKSEPNTPKFAGIRDLMKTPKSSSENEQDEADKLAMMAKLLKTPECSKNNEEAPSSSMKGVKELLKTPKHLATPHLKGIRELMKTPKLRNTPDTTGVKELLKTPLPQTCADAQDTDSTIEDTKTLPEDLPSSTSQNEASLEGIKELLKTPKGCSTPHRTGLRELTKTPKMRSTPMLRGIKELTADSTAQQKDQGLEKFLRTPTAKNIMIPSMPSSAVIEKSGDSIEISTEYDLNATNASESANLDEFFENPVGTCFAERMAGSYYGEKKVDEEETMQGELYKTADEAFDKLIGQESQIHTPIRKSYTRKSFSLQTPTCSSPFTAAEILSDLPKTDVEEWIESLDQAEPPTIIECGEDVEENNAKVEVNEEVDINTLETGENCSIKREQNINLDDSIIPETCAKIFIKEKFLQDNCSTSFTYVDTKDPLLNNYTEVKEKVALAPVTSIEAEISGINLLDQTIESIQDEPSMLDEPLFVEEPSIFDELLVVSDNESEGECRLTFTNNHETSQDEGNDLSEPLLVSDSEDLNVSQERDMNNKTVNSVPVVTDTNAQEKSMLEKLSIKIDLLAEDPLEVEDQNTAVSVVEEQSTIVKNDVIENELDCLEKSVVNAGADESNRTKDVIQILTQTETAVISKNVHKSSVEIIPPQVITEDHSQELTFIDNVAQESSTQQNSEAMADSKISSTSQIDESEKDPVSNVDIGITIGNIDAEIDAAETVSHQTDYENTEKSPVENAESKVVAIEQTKIVSPKSEDIFVDTSVTEICEETNILNEEQIEMRESSQVISKTSTARECRDIFMDNSNIDESFAHEAIHEESCAAMSVTIMKTSIEEQGVLHLPETEEEMIVATTETFEEAVLPNQRSKQTEFNTSLTDIDQCVSVVEHSGNTQFETQTRTTSELKKEFVDEIAVDSTARKVDVTEKGSVLKEIESQSNQGGYIEQECSKPESSSSKFIQETTNIVKETVNLCATLPDENLIDIKEKLESCSKVADANVRKVSSNVFSEHSETYVGEKEIVCAMEETGKKTNFSVEDPSTQVSINEFLSSPNAGSQTLSVEFKDDKNISDAKIEHNKSKETTTTTCLEAVEHQHIEMNVKSEIEEIHANIENKIEDVISGKEFSEKNPQTSKPESSASTSILESTNIVKRTVKLHTTLPDENLIAIKEKLESCSEVADANVRKVSPHVISETNVNENEIVCATEETEEKPKRSLENPSTEVSINEFLSSPTADSQKLAVEFKDDKNISDAKIEHNKSKATITTKCLEAVEHQHIDLNVKSEIEEIHANIEHKIEDVISGNEPSGKNPQTSKPESSASTSILESINIVKRTVKLHTTLPDENLIAIKEKMESCSEVADANERKVSPHVFSEPSETYVDKNAIVCATEETEEKTNPSMKDPSTEVSINEFLSSLTTDSEKLSFKCKDDKNISDAKIEHKRSKETINTKCLDAVEHQHVEMNATPEIEDIHANIESKIDDVISEKECSAKNLQSSENTEKDHITELSKEYKDTDANEGITSKGNAKTTINLSMQHRLAKSTSEERICLEESINNTSTQKVTYNFEVKISERNRVEKGGQVELDELATTSSQIECSRVIEVINEVTPITDEQPHKTEAMQINENVENSPVESADIVTVFEEMGQEGVSGVKTRGRQLIVTESTQESIAGVEVRKSSRRDCRKVNESHVEGKPLEIVEDTIYDMVKDDEKTKRKRTASESSHGSVKDNDAGCTRTRKGGRRKIQKHLNKPIVEEQQKCVETICTEVEENSTGAEKSADIEVVHKVQKQEDNVFTAVQEETTRAEKPSPNIEKDIPGCVSRGGDGNILPLAKSEMASDEPLAEKLSVESQDITNLSVSIKQDSNKLEEQESGVSNALSTKKLQRKYLENVVESQTTSPDVSKVKELDSQTLPDEPSVDDKISHKSELSNHFVASEQTLNIDTVQEVIAEKSEQLSSKKMRSKHTVSESSQDLARQDENTSIEIHITKVQNKSVGVTLFQEECQEDEEITSAKIINKGEHISEESAPLDSEEKIDQTVSATLKSEKMPHKLSPSQDSQPEDGKPRSKKNRRKIQKAPVEEAVAEESKEEVLLTTIRNETDKIDAKIGENTQAKQTSVEEGESLIADVDQIVMSNVVLGKSDEIVLENRKLSKTPTLPQSEKQTNQVPTVSLDVVEPNHKRTRRKITASESSVENETLRTRRGGRKIQKAVVEVNKIVEEAKDSSPELNKNEDGVTKKAKISKLQTNKHELIINQEETAKTDETEELQQEQETAVKSLEHIESEEKISRHGKGKAVLYETVLEDQITSRKAEVSSTELVICKPESEIKTPHAEAEQKSVTSNISTVDRNVEESNGEEVALNVDSSPNKTGKRGKPHKIEAKKLSKDDASHKSIENFTEQSEQDSKQRSKRGRPRKVDGTKGTNPENTEQTVSTPHMTRRAGRHNKETAESGTTSVVHKGRSTNRNRKTPVEHITGDSQDEQIFAISTRANEMLDEQATTPSKMTLPKEKEIKEDEYFNREIALPCDADHQKDETKSVKKPVKRTHSPPDLTQLADEKPVKQSKPEILVVGNSDERDSEAGLANFTLKQKTDNKNVLHQDEIKKDGAVKPQRSTKRQAAAKREQQDKLYEEPTTKSRRKKVAEDVKEPKSEDVLMTEVKAAEVELSPGEEISSQEENQIVKIKESQTTSTVDEKHSKELEAPLLSTRRRAIARHIEHNHDASSSSSKKRVGGRKQVVEDHETEELVTLVKTNEIEQTQDEKEAHKKEYDAEEESTQTKSGGAKGSRRNIGKKKVDNKNIHLTEENKKEDDEATDIEKQHSQDDYHNVNSENEQPQEEPKRERSRKKKNDNKEESKEPATAHSPVIKSRGRKRKEINTNANEHISKEKEHPTENVEPQPLETPVRAASTAKSGLKVIEHITAESQEAEDTPGRRARNVPQRKAATAYHNYDETSDSETISKTKKKGDTPKKSPEATKNSPIATVTSASVITASPSLPATPSITTARGRTRKPTAKVQQYLEEERAKAGTPKKRAILAAAASSEATTPQPTPVRRGRKASTEIRAEGTPQAGKGRGRGKVVALHAHKEESSDLPTTTKIPVEEKSDELQAAATTQNSAKTRVGGRKAKIADEENHSTDEPPPKKNPIELESAKQESSPSSDHPTPTRIAGRRNAAAAAKARIEEDALAAAAIEPPKRVRAKKVTQKVSTQLISTTDTENHSTTEVEDEVDIKTEKEVKNRNYLSKKREHRLASCSTVEGAEDLQIDDEATETREKTPNKRGRKPAAITTTDSPAVPAKRGRKPKTAETVADPKAPVESKTTKGRGRGRKNVHFDGHEVDASSSQQIETDVEAAPVDTPEPVKRGTRTRRK